MQKLVHIYQSRPINYELKTIGFHILAMSYLRAGELDQAVQYLTEGQYYAPKEHKSYFNNALTVAYLQQKNADAALEIIQATPAVTKVQQEQHTVLGLSLKL